VIRRRAFGRRDLDARMSHASSQPQRIAPGQGRLYPNLGITDLSLEFGYNRPVPCVRGLECKWTCPLDTPRDALRLRPDNADARRNLDSAPAAKLRRANPYSNKQCSKIPIFPPCSARQLAARLSWLVSRRPHARRTTPSAIF
jgi:hypothetical protein